MSTRLSFGIAVIALVAGVGWWNIAGQPSPHALGEDLVGLREPVSLARPHHLTIEISADENTIYAESWDGTDVMTGFPGSSLPIFAPFSTKSPPDLAICLVSVAEADCRSTTDAQGNPMSFFHDRYEAVFEFDMPAENAFGFFVYDVDDPWPDGQLTHDLIDMVIIAPMGEDGEAIEASLRSVAEQLTPTRWKIGGDRMEGHEIEFYKAEAKRRLGPIPIVDLNQCSNEQCRLEQSAIRVVAR